MSILNDEFEQLDRDLRRSPELLIDRMLIFRFSAM